MSVKRGRPKQVRPHEIVLQLPKDALKYKAKRLYWVLLEYEKKMARDITSVKMSDYNIVLDNYIATCQDLNKKGITYGTNAKQRMAKRRMVQNESNGSPTEDSGNGSSSLGVGIPSVNPLT